VVVGAIALVMAMSVLPPRMVTHFQGCERRLRRAGASVMTRGDFCPWRDLLFVHGVFRTCWPESLWRAVFGRSIWASSPYPQLIMVPCLGLASALRRLGQ